MSHVPMLMVLVRVKPPAVMGTCTVTASGLCWVLTRAYVVAPARVCTAPSEAADATAAFRKTALGGSDMSCSAAWRILETGLRWRSAIRIAEGTCRRCDPRRRRRAGMVFMRVIGGKGTDASLREAGDGPKKVRLQSADEPGVDQVDVTICGEKRSARQVCRMEAGPRLAAHAIGLHPGVVGCRLAVRIRARNGIGQVGGGERGLNPGIVGIYGAAVAFPADDRLVRGEHRVRERHGRSEERRVGQECRS